MTPHFDFHFYLISREEIAAIDCKSESKPAALPAGAPSVVRTAARLKRLPAATLRAWPPTGTVAPRYVELREALPMGATGKVLKRALRDG